jgi:hypothetical protein
MNANNELEGMLKEDVLQYFKVLYQQLRGGTEEYNDKF